MKAYILMVGSELLSGMMVDTNSSYIAEELNKYSIEISGKMIVGDKMADIKDALKIACDRADIVVMSGGLGPTIDDLTRDAVAEFLGKKMVIDEKRFEMMKERYKNIITGVMPERNIRQVMFPEGAYIVENKKGSACPFYIDKVVCFPGVPYELQDTFPRFMEYYSAEKDIKTSLYIKDILVWGIPESELERRILDIIEDEKEVFIEFLVKDYGIIIRLLCDISLKEKADIIKIKIYERVGESIFGEDEERIENILVELLKKEWLDISVAESCTGGLIASILTGVSGVSEVFTEGLITYSNESKMERLGVSKEALDKHGAVSTYTAREMLRGLKTDTGIAVSGIAGPNGGSEDKPVGTVIIGTRIHEDIVAEKYFFTGDRDRIRRRAAVTALDNMRKRLKKYIQEKG